MVRFEDFRGEFRRALEESFGRDTVLPFWGNATAKIVHIGQAPSQSGLRRQKPFADKTGEKLREWYGVGEEVFYDRDKFYFTALGMYFPGKAKNGGDKLPDMTFAKKWLSRELGFLRPKLYILLGRVAAGFFFGKGWFEELVRVDQEIEGVETVVLPHASPLNIKWFKDHPWFMEERLGEVRRKIERVLTGNDY